MVQKKPGNIINVLGTDALPGLPMGFTAGTASSKHLHLDLGDWDLLSSNWSRSSFQLLLSKGVTIWERAACLERVQQCDAACGGFLAVIARNCLVLEYLVPLFYLPHRAPSVLPGDPQARQLSPVSQSCTRLIGAVTSPAALCAVSLKKRRKKKVRGRPFPSTCCSKYSQHPVNVCSCPT